MERLKFCPVVKEKCRGVCRVCHTKRPHPRIYLIYRLLSNLKRLKINYQLKTNKKIKRLVDFLEC